MLRLRLASLAVACGLLVSLSGCSSMSGSSTCDDGRFRLFRNSSFRPGIFHGGQNGTSAECECQNGHMMDGMHGPLMPTPIGASQTMPIPITSIPPAAQPPQVFKLPTAPATPYVPSIH
jgi:hypothetical protein